MGKIIRLPSKDDPILPKYSKCKISIAIKDDDLDFQVTPPELLETTEGREILADYCLILAQIIFNEDERVRDLFIPS